MHQDTCAPGQTVVPSPCLLAWCCPGMHPAVLQQTEIRLSTHLAQLDTCYPDNDFAQNPENMGCKSLIFGNTVYLLPHCSHSPTPPGVICAEKHTEAVLLQVRHGTPGLAHGALVCCTCLSWHSLPRHPTFCSPPGTLPGQKAAQTSYHRLSNSPVLTPALLCQHCANYLRFPHLPAHAYSHCRGGSGTSSQPPANSARQLWTPQRP